MRFPIFFVLFISTIVVHAQNTPITRPATSIEIFNEQEKEYISSWIKDSIEDMDLSETELRAYQEIWKDYSAKFEELGVLSEGWTKKELIKKFNALIEEHFNEIQLVFEPNHFKEYQKEFKVLLWNVSLRLERL